MPNSAPLKLKDFVRRLLAYEMAADPGGAVPFRVFEKLRKPLVPLTGVGGFRSLLSRSLALANTEVAWLRAVHIRGDGSLEGLDELQSRLSREDIGRGEEALATRFVGLLVTFIGPTLTLQLLQDVWPDMDELDF